MPAALTPVTITHKATNVRTRKAEAMEAVSTDGQWRYVRLDMAGTPWEVTHLPTGRAFWVGSLRKARLLTADDQDLA